MRLNAVARLIGRVRGHRLPGYLLFAVSVVLVSYRFANHDLFSFVLDEPQFLDAARAQLATGKWASASPIAGNQGLHYGPAIVWLHGAIDLVAGPAPGIHILVMTMLMVAAHIILALGLGRLYGDRIMVSATVLVVLASSPYQFLWSRVAWDELVDVNVALAVGLLCWRSQLSAGRALAIGALLGLALSTHLMVSPLTVFLLGLVVVQSPRGRRIVNTLLVVGCVGVINLPYASYLTGQASSPTPGVPLDWTRFLIFLKEPVRVATLAGFQHFLENDWTIFTQVSPTWGVVDRLDTTVAVLAIGVALTLVLTMIGASTRHRRRTAMLALAVWIGYAFFFTWRGQRSQPYYQWTSYWIVPVAVAGMCNLLRQRLSWLRPILIGLVWMGALFQMQFLTDWMHFIRDRGGTRGTAYGTVLSEQRRMVRLACRQSAGPVVLRLEVATFLESLSYLAAIEPLCFGKKLYADGQAPPEVPIRTVVYQPGSARYDLR